MPPGRCLSTFPARPSVRNGEALSRIRLGLWVTFPLPCQTQYPDTVHGVQAGPAVPGKVQGDASHVVMPTMG